MNTVKTGDDFENTVYKIFKDLLESDKLPYNSKYSEIFQKKKYYSSKREKNIIFDIAIEVYHPGTKHISLIIPIECKDYSNSISVDNIEEFCSKSRQIGDFNIKAIFVSTNTLQEGALKFAQNSNLAVVRILPIEQVEWIFYQMTLEEFEELKQKQSGIKNVSEAITSTRFKAIERDFFGIFENKTFDSFENLLSKIIK